MTEDRSQTEGPDAEVAPIPLVELRGITKTFGAVVACDRVDLDLRRGRIHGILGENGAGKSTLVKVLIGLVSPDGGSIVIDGEPCVIRDPLEAARRGIGMVHQHFSLVDALTVWENVALGDAGPLNPTIVRQRIGEISDHYGLDVDPYARVADLPGGLRQRVEIIKCLRRDPVIVVLDEPTSVLSPEESTQLFVSLRQVVAEEGRAVALVSHKLDEVLRATDDVTVMRNGRVVARMPTIDADAPSLARAMVGREVSLRSERVALGIVDDTLEGTVDRRTIARSGDRGPSLRLSELVVERRRGPRMLDGLTIEVHPGEIVGVAGVEGNGQRPLADVLSSLVPLDAGIIEVDGTAVTPGRVGAMARAGVGVIPEDRHDSGIVVDMTVAENLVLVDPARVATHGVIDGRQVGLRAEELIEEFAIDCWGPDAPMWSLSGGNQQRVVLARELSQDPTVLVAAQPTRGLDVGAIEYMTARLTAVAETGVGVLLISSELEEILDLADRIVVLHRGRIVSEMDREHADRERLGLLMGGGLA